MLVNGKDFYAIYVTVNGIERERKYYTQECRISKFCNKMYAKYGEGTKCEVYKNMKLMEIWGE